MNPILVREVRARWRGWRDPGILFGYAALLALSVVLMYASTSTFGDSFQQQTGRLGHEMFLALSGMQIAGWMLLGPALTATSIAGEREAGLLDSLQLTPMTPRQLAWGKLASAASFFGLLMLAPLPVTAICFLTGGVSPGEFCAVFALQAATALGAAAIGLFASAWCRRASGALGLAYGLMAAWAISSFFVMAAHHSTYVWAYSPVGAGWFRKLFSIGADFFWRTNPIIAFYENSNYPTWTSIYLPFNHLPINVPDWVLSALFQTVAAALMMKSVARALRRPLPDAIEEQEARQHGLLRRFLTRPMLLRPRPKYSCATHNSAQWDSASSKRFTTLPSTSIHATRESGWWEWRRLASVRFANPVLEREIRRRARMRRPAPWLRQLLRIALGVFVGGYLWGFSYVFLEPENRREGAWWIVSCVGLALVMCAAASLGASAFAREREAGTWQGLELSLLSPREIVWGKVVAPFLACAAFSVVLWTLLLPCVYQVVVSHSDGHQYSPRYGVSLTQACGTLLIMLSTAWAYCCWGVFVSWWCRRLWVAVVWSFASSLLVLVLVPMLYFMSVRGSADTALDFFRLWHPLFAVASAANAHSFSRPQITVTPIALSYAATLGCFGLALLAILQERIKVALHGESSSAVTSVSSSGEGA